MKEALCYMISNLCQQRENCASVLNVFDVSEFSISGVRVGVGGLSSWLSQATCWWNDQRKWNPPKIMESIEHYVWRWEQTGENLMSVTGHAVHEAANLWGERKNVPQIGHPKSHENQIDRSPYGTEVKHIFCLKKTHFVRVDISPGGKFMHERRYATYT